MGYRGADYFALSVGLSVGSGIASIAAASCGEVLGRRALCVRPMGRQCGTSSLSALTRYVSLGRQLLFRRQRGHVDVGLLTLLCVSD